MSPESEDERIEVPRRLHPATLAIRFLERLPQFVFGLPAVAYFTTDLGIGMLLLIALAGFLVAMLSAWIYWRRFSYETADEQLVIESGVFSRNRRTIPFDRIQDVSLEQSLLARIFGVSIVRIETGSAGKDEGKLDCVARSEADRLRDLIRAHRHGAAAASADAATEPDRPPLFAMDPPRLLLFGLFSFSFVFLAILGGIWQYLGSFLPVELTPDEWIDNRAESVIRFVSVGAALSFAGALLLIGMATGIVRTFLRDFGFRLTRTESGLRRERGLFTRTDVVIPIKRLQAAIVSTGLVRRLFGWHGLALQSLGTDGKAGAHHDAAPFAQIDELTPIFAEMALPLPPERARFSRVSQRSPLARAVIPAIGLSIGAIAALIFDPRLLIPVAAGVAAIGPIIWLSWRAHGHALDAGTLFVRRGVTQPRMTILPLPKVQTVTLRQTLLQRPFGLVSLLVGTAGASRMMPLAVRDLDPLTARRLRDALLAPGASSD